MASVERTHSLATERESETQWLTQEELRTWMAYRGVIHFVDAALDRDLRAESGLSHNDYQILARLSNAPEHRLRMSELADMVFASRSRLTYQITQLEQEGLVQREGYEMDKRGAMAVLTPKGQEVLRVAAPGHITSIRRVFFDRLTSEQITVLGDAFHSIFTGLKEAEHLEGAIGRELDRGK